MQKRFFVYRNICSKRNTNLCGYLWEGRKKEEEKKRGKENGRGLDSVVYELCL